MNNGADGGTRGTTPQNGNTSMENTSSRQSGMRLYGGEHQRLYINADERAHFRAAAEAAPLPIQTFSLTILYTGCRISEALALTGTAIQPENQVITFATLKRRRSGVYREVPVPPYLIEALVRHQDSARRSDNVRLWQHLGNPINRSTGYRWVKSVMHQADIFGARACPKGLRHGFAVHALHCGVPLNLVQRWLGHSSMTTTAIYANAVGPEELSIAGRMW